ncbi:phosphotransferase [Owenweeksia hongkongensis]|uniref:phosphotransferase n=1 Tax=Owenweeksia hongkongensis TaxID=253245 RepID=UPI003A8EFF14
MTKLTTDKNDLQAYLKSQGWLGENETLKSTEVPGEGNMNFTLRVNTGERTFIVKQSRDFVEKYPQVAAPAERALREAEFYELISEKPELKAMMPNILGLDKENNVMVMDDLGAGSDYTHVYKKGQIIPEDELMQIMDFAADLHNGFSAKTASKVIHNRKMRELNHEHMFVYPYLDDNGLNLDDILPGLAEIEKMYKADEELKAELEKMGKLYLADEDKLLHGDYFLGSWLKTKDGVRIIDPEFCFFGPAEFEIGVTIAHLKMADQPEELIAKALAHYSAKAKLDEDLRKKFTATEILRRILGLAQLPLEIDLEKRKSLLTEARRILIKH